MNVTVSSTSNISFNFIFFLIKWFYQKKTGVAVGIVPAPRSECTNIRLIFEILPLLYVLQIEENSRCTEGYKSDAACVGSTHNQ